MNHRFIFPLLLTVALVACSNESKHNPSETNNTASPTASVSLATFNEPEPTDWYEKYAWLNRQAQAQLQQADAAQANRLYDQYRNQTDAVLQAINEQEATFLENYADDANWQNDETASQPQATAQLLAKQQQLAQFGLRYVEIGAGMAEIAPLSDTETKLFADKVSPDYRAFITQEEHENKQLADTDNAIVISWAELGKRVAFWEQFVQQQPTSPLTEEAKQRLTWYTDAFLFGLANTPVQDGSQLPEGATQDEAKRIYDEMQYAWQIFERQYPHSPITPHLAHARTIAALSDDEREVAIETWRTQQRGTAASQP